MAQDLTYTQCGDYFITDITHDGYDVFLKDGRTFHCRTKLQIR